MKIEDFLSDKNISKKERAICLSVYGNVDKTEKGWQKELTGTVNFSTKDPAEVQVVAEEPEKEIKEVTNIKKNK